MDNDRPTKTEDALVVLQRVREILNEWGASPYEIGRMLNTDPDDVIAWSRRLPDRVDHIVFERLILIESISEHLRTLFPMDHARWPRLPNDAPLFAERRRCHCLRPEN